MQGAGMKMWPQTSDLPNVVGSEEELEVSEHLYLFKKIIYLRKLNIYRTRLYIYIHYILHRCVKQTNQIVP